jgi:hypothetical protein
LRNKSHDQPSIRLSLARCRQNYDFIKPLMPHTYSQLFFCANHFNEVRKGEFFILKLFLISMKVLMGHFAWFVRRSRIFLFNLIEWTIECSSCGKMLSLEINFLKIFERDDSTEFNRFAIISPLAANFPLL